MANAHRPRGARYPGLKGLPDRTPLYGMLFVLHAGIVWRHLPPELGFGSGISCWRRLEDWEQTGVGGELHSLLFSRLGAAGEIVIVKRDLRPPRCGTSP